MGDLRAKVAERVMTALADRSPTRFSGGTHRVVTPEETLARTAPVAAAAGITRVGGIGGLDRIGLPVVTAYRPASRNLAVSQGKGVTEAAARASAVMEAVELWHAERHSLLLRTASTRHLQESGVAHLDPASLVRCPCSEYAPERPLRWTPGVRLSTGTPVEVPYEAVHCDWRLPTAAGEHSVQNGSNGLASGNTLPEAVVHGLCEVVERDAVVAFDRLPPEESAARRVDLATVEDPVCRDLVERFDACGVELVVWDMTSDVGVPTYSCVAVETKAPWYQPLPQTQGSGTHPVPHVALSRAVTETAQARAAVIGGSRDDIFDERYATYFDEAHRMRVATETATPALRPFALEPGARHASPREDLDWLLDRLDAAGHDDVIVVDLTHSRWRVPVVKVVVPGLEWRPWED